MTVRELVTSETGNTSYSNVPYHYTDQYRLPEPIFNVLSTGETGTVVDLLRSNTESYTSSLDLAVQAQVAIALMRQKPETYEALRALELLPKFTSTGMFPLLVVGDLLGAYLDLFRKRIATGFEAVERKGSQIGKIYLFDKDDTLICTAVDNVVMNSSPKSTYVVWDGTDLTPPRLAAGEQLVSDMGPVYWAKEGTGSDPDNPDTRDEALNIERADDYIRYVLYPTRFEPYRYRRSPNK